jgi:hypothetical protein
MRISVASFLILCVVRAGTLASTWTESSFEDFSDGTLFDAGSNLYVSARGRIQIVNRWDLNDDGNLDILLPGGHGHTEKENVYIYLNRDGDIDARSRIELPGNGSARGLVYDFNKDGFNDIAVANFRDSHWSWIDSYVYYGSANGFSADNRAELPAYWASGLAAADFNGDGWTDLAFACRWQDGEFERPTGPKTSFIYWNSTEGFSPQRRLPLEFGDQFPNDAVAGDLDGDGDPDLALIGDENIWIYYSSLGAFEDRSKREVLPLGGTRGDLGDVNGDGHPDLAIAAKKGVRVLFGSADGVQTEGALSIPVSNPQDVALGDLDGDGLDDLAVANHSGEDGSTWPDSFIFFSNGKDFSSRESIALPTLGASGVSAADLDGDGDRDLVFSHQQLTNQYDLFSYVYWNDGGAFRFGNHTPLPTRGPVSCAIGDVDNDDDLDVLFFQDEGGFRDGPVTGRLYWGNGTRTFSEGNSMEFVTGHIFGQAHADLNDDGHMDLILSQYSTLSTVDHQQIGLLVYWGKGDGNDFDGPTLLTMISDHGGCRIADLNRDGWLDLVSGGYSADPADSERKGLTIFWGSESGLSNRNRQVIPFEPYKLRAPVLMDLNRDGFLDIGSQIETGTFTIWWGDAEGYSENRTQLIDLEREDELMYAKAADLNKDGWLDLFLPRRGLPSGELGTSFIYYGSTNGFSNDNRTEVDSYVAYDNSIADFDGDGWLDLFICSYGGEFSGNKPSLLHWGGPNGFGDRPVTEIETYGASGSEVLDYDGDGYLDLLIANHRKSGSTKEPIPHRHITDSMLYWGSKDGFSTGNRTTIPTIGPSGLNVRDPGNSYDRGLYEDYISSPYRIPDGERPSSIVWEAETPHGSSVRFQIRTADEVTKLEDAAWRGPTGSESWFEKPETGISATEGDWIQYRARLSTPNGGSTPYVNRVTIEFQ